VEKGGTTVDTIYTIGHSNHGIERFLELLQAFKIETLIDVRSNPVSRYSPHFVKENLRSSLESSGIRYIYLGDKLGGKPADPALRDAEGRVSYALVAQSQAFRQGLDIAVREAGKGRTAIMCAEENPRNCHRYHLDTPSLTARGLTVVHIRGSGEVETQEDLERGQTRLDI
jgi:uncharacterized protein (DUF488 family)